MVRSHASSSRFIKTRPYRYLSVCSLVITLLALPVIVGSHLPVARAADPYSSTVLADNPISYWQLQETSGTTAVDSKGATNGAVLGATKAQPDPSYGKVTEFIGPQYGARFGPNGEFMGFL